MTTRVDFYVLQSEDAATRRVSACRVIEKIYRQGHSLFVRLDTEEESQRFDDLLWTFRQGSFVPHESQASPEVDAPVILGFGSEVPGGQDVLLNFGEDLPLGHERYGRIVEVIDQDPSVRGAGRLRYRQYQTAGMELQTHQI
jgi:DNA polymerase III subunit chi